MDQERLEAYEKMHLAIIQDQEKVIFQMERLKRRGKKNSASYKQLLVQKISNKNMLDMYKIYGIELPKGE